MDALFIILTGGLFATSCALLGSFLILRKMAMVGDAISHAVLPGIVIAFLLSGSRDTAGMLIGAAAIGLLTTFFIEFLTNKARLQSDASIGVTFTALFALGVILISAFAGQVDLDQECVLYGEIAYTPLDVWVLDNGTSLGPKSVYIASITLLLNLLLILFGYRKLHLTTFDPAFAATIGISVASWNYLLMGAVSFTTVAAFESVGAILILALLVAPAATAYLISTKLHRMLLLSVLFAWSSSISGYYLAAYLDASIAGAIVSAAGLQFGLIYGLTLLLKKRPHISESVQ